MGGDVEKGSDRVLLGTGSNSSSIASSASSPMPSLSTWSSLSSMDPRKLYSGLALLPLLVSGPILANVSKDPVTGRYPYHPAVAVMMIEALKFFIGVVLYLHSFGRQSPRLLSGYGTWERFLKMSVYFSVPAVVYAIANNLVFVGLQYLDPTVYQLLNNLKILSTAVLSYFFLRKQLTRVQWISLVVLTCGAAVTQLKTECPVVATPELGSPNGSASLKNDLKSPANQFFGVVVSLVVALCSGIAGVWTEYVMKGRGVVLDQPIQLQNIQLYAYGMAVHSVIVYYQAGDFIAANGFFAGFGFWTWATVLNQCLMGFSVSFLMKYADNIVKVFINCVAMLIVALLSATMFGTELTAQVWLAIILVASSILLYNT